MPAPAGVRRAARTVVPDVLRLERRFRVLWIAQALSVLGDLVTPVALAFAVLAIGSTADLAIVVACGLAPFALLSIAGGVWADRIGRRRVMIASDAVRFVAQGTLAVLLLTGAAEVWMVAALTAVFGAADAFFSPAMAGLIPELVPSERIQDANATIALTRSVASVAGPIIAGVLIALTGPGEAIAFDALTFATSAILLTALSTDTAVATAHDDEHVGFGQSLRDGWSEIRAHRWIQMGLTAEGIYTVVLLPAIYVLGPVLAERDLDGASSWAAIVAAFGVGAVVGNAIALRWRPARPLRAAAAMLVLASLQGAIIGSGLSTAGIAVLEAFSGVGVALYWTLWDTTIQEQVRPDRVARVAAYDFAIALGLMPIGVLLAVPVSDALGLHATLRWMSVCGVLGALALLATRDARRLRRPATRTVPAAQEADAPGDATGRAR